MNRRAELWCWVLIVVTLLYLAAHVVVAVVRGTLGNV